MKIDHGTAGVFAIAPTPFFDDGTIDEKSVARMTDFYLQAGCTGITVLGIMGEAHKLAPEEALGVAARVIARAGTAPVIVGVSSPDLAAMRTLAQGAMGRGAAGVMIAPQRGLGDEDEIADYFRNAVQAIGADVPWVLQDYPLAIGVTMSPALIRRIVTGNPSLVMLKHEDWPGLEKIAALRGFEKDGAMRPISILTGNGALFLDFEMERGANGAMTGYAFPEMLVDVVRLSEEGRRAAAHDLFDAHLPLVRYEQQQGLGLAVRKYVLWRRGVLSCDAQRKPGSMLSASAKTEVEFLLARLARLDARADLQPRLAGVS